MAPKQTRSTRARAEPSSSSRVQSPPRRNTRRGRSASQEVSEVETTSSTRRGTRRQDRGSSIEGADNTASKSGPKAGSKGKTDGKRRRETLPPLAEDVAGQNEGQFQSPAVNSEFSGTTHVTNHSEGDDSKLDVEIMLDLLPDLENHSSKIFRTLAGESGDSSSDWKEIQQPDSKIAKRMSYHEGQFKIVVEAFGGSQYIKLSKVLGSFLSEEEIAQLDSEHVAINLILRKANLAQFVQKLIRLQSDSPDTLLTLQYNDAEYPQPFFPASKLTSEIRPLPRLRTTLYSSAFEVGLDLRTQLLISVLSSDSTSSRDPYEVLAEVFKTGKYFRGWGFPGLGTFRKSGSPQNTPIVGSTYTQQVARRMESIKLSFPSGSRDRAETVDLDDLRFRFPWNPFISHLLRWSMMYVRELDHDIKLSHGFQKIADSFRFAIFTKNYQALQIFPEVAAGDRNSAFDKPTNDNALSRIKLNNPSTIAFLKAREATLKAGRPGGSDQVPDLQQEKAKSSTPKTRQSHGELVRSNLSTQPVSPRKQIPQTDVASTAPARVTNEMVPQDLDNYTPAPIEDDEQLVSDESDFDDDLLEPYATLGAKRRYIQEAQQRGLEALQRDSKEGSKENFGRKGSTADRPTKRRRLIDKQDDAVRLDFNEEDELLSQQVPSAQPRQRTVLGILPLPLVPLVPSAPSDAESEDAFQVADRVEESRRSRTAVASYGQADSRTREATTQASVSTSEANDEESVQSSALPSSRFTKSQQYQNSYNLPEASQKARIAVADYRKWKPQKRRAFSQEEQDQLIQLVEKYGCKWSDLEKNQISKGSPLYGRDQVALKDKARNIKFTLLKAKRPADSSDNLPPNFEAVTLSSAQRSVLDGMNIIY